jgi:hypothetical protein
MDNLERCVDIIASLRSCVLKDPQGLPSIPNGLVLPDDVRGFYSRSGGAVLFKEAPFSIEIVSPQEFVRANPVIRGQRGEHDVSFNWFIVCQSKPQYITIDLDPRRLGRCYDSFWDRHAMRGDCAIIAHSFTALLEALIAAQGKHLFWLSDSFVPLGDAYDDVVQ